MKIRTAHIGYTAVFAASFAAAWFLPVSELLKDVIYLPGIGALCLLLNQLWRDERAHDRALELQNRQQDFALGTASHMANVAYDKHVIFCEEYMERVQKGFQELMQHGPTKGAMNIGGDLVRIRFKHSAWLTKEIEGKLKPFEMALINMGAKEHLLESLPTGEKRSKVVDEVFRFFGLIMGDEKPSEAEIGMAKDDVIEEIRIILGIHTLTMLRQAAAKLALKRIN